MNCSTPGLPVHHQLLEFTQMSIESVMPSSHLILCHPLLLLPPIPPRIRVFSNESTLCMRWPKHWSFSFSISPSKEHLIEHQYLGNTVYCYHFHFKRLEGLLSHHGHIYLVILKHFLTQYSNIPLKQLWLYKDLLYQRLTVSVAYKFGISFLLLL